MPGSNDGCPMLLALDSTTMLMVGSVGFLSLCLLMAISFLQGLRNSSILTWMISMLLKAVLLFYMSRETETSLNLLIVLFALAALVLLTLLDISVTNRYFKRGNSRPLNLFLILACVALLYIHFYSDLIVENFAFIFSVGIIALLHFFGFKRVYNSNKIGTLPFTLIFLIYCTALAANIYMLIPHINTILATDGSILNVENLNGPGLLSLVYAYTNAFTFCAMMTLIMFGDSAEIRKRSLALDKTTEALNLDGFIEVSQRTRHMCARLDQQVSLIAIKIDNIDELTRASSIMSTNNVLKKFVKSIKYCLRKHDQIARIGKVDFLILLPFTDIEKGKLATTRLTKHLGTEIWDGENEYLALQVKIGITNVPRKEDTLKPSIERALRAMQNSKPNQISVMPAPTILQTTSGGAET